MLDPIVRASDSNLPVRLTRRWLVGAAAGGALLLSGDARAMLGWQQPALPPPLGRTTWLLADAAELRPAPPPPPTVHELTELLTLQTRRTGATLAAIDRWAGRAAVLPWTEVALDLIRAHRPNPPRAARALALLHVAIADAVAAARDARTAHPRPAPPKDLVGLDPVGFAGGGPSFPTDHAAVAGAATTTLRYLFPAAKRGLVALREEAAAVALHAGVAYRSDVEAGLAIGHAVGQRAVAWGRADGSDASWDGQRPTGEGTWRPTPPEFRTEPIEPLAGTWRTWVLPGVDALRPPPPPAWGSAEWRANLRAVQRAVAQRTPAQEAAVRFWAGGPGTVTPPGLWVEIARDLIARDWMDLPDASRILALITVAMYDAFVCCWDAKYAYWTARPITADPGLNVLIPTPPFPSFTSGHSTVSAAAATVLGHLFPAARSDLARLAREAKDSRLWAGIHYPIDNNVGAAGGAAVGRLVVGSAPARG